MALFQCSFFSESLKISTGMTVLLPQSCEGQIGMEGSESTEPPGVLYLLHGLFDDHTAWLRYSAIERYVESRSLAVVMPNAHRSFYTNMVSGGAYWTFISEELPKLVGSFFNVSRDWRKTFVAGLSMGGYGAFKLALAHPSRFAAAASLSGCLDIHSIATEEKAATRDEYESIFGPLDQLPGSENDPLALLDRFPTSGKTKFYQCCGTEDFLYEENLTFRDRAQAKGLDLLYEEHAGETHEWSYWNRQIQRVLEWLPDSGMAE